MTYTLPKLDYDYNALEPHIDARTMEIHHTKHHQAYVDNLNKALTSANITSDTDIIDLIRDLSQLPESIRTAVRNNGGGHANHAFFWKSLMPQAPSGPSNQLLNAINHTFGSLEAFKTQFAQASLTRFGSGWAWLGVKKDHSLCITSTPNQDSPWMINLADCPCTPILGLDVWEHAYYLHYQNRRADYIASFWNIIAWPVIEERYLAALQ